MLDLPGARPGSPYRPGPVEPAPRRARDLEAGARFGKRASDRAPRGRPGPAPPSVSAETKAEPHRVTGEAMDRSAARSRYGPARSPSGPELPIPGTGSWGSGSWPPPWPLHSQSLEQGVIPKTGEMLNRTGVALADIPTLRASQAFASRASQPGLGEVSRLEIRSRPPRRLPRQKSPSWDRWRLGHRPPLGRPSGRGQDRRAGVDLRGGRHGHRRVLGPAPLSG